MKQSYYFPHDYHARHDPKLERLFLTMGYEGWGIYWALIEALYEQGGYLRLDDINLYSKGDKPLCERITNVVRGFNLFKFDDTRFWSESCLLRLDKMVLKREKASISAQKRWGNANAMPTQCEGNAINKGDKGDKGKASHTPMSYFYLTYEKIFKTPYIPHAGKDWQVFDDLKKKLPDDKIISLIDKFFKCDDKWVKEKGFTVQIFGSRVNQLQAEKKTRIIA